MKIIGHDYRPLLVIVIVVLCSASASRNFSIAESSSMRILSPPPKLTPKDVVSSSFVVSIRVGDVDHVLSERITTAIGNYFRRSAAEAVVARNESNATILDLACTIHYAKSVNQANLIHSLRQRYIFSCFPERNTRGRAVHVDVRPLERWDDSSVQTYSSLWSNAPWRLVFAGRGAPVGRAAGSRLAPSFCAPPPTL